MTNDAPWRSPSEPDDQGSTPSPFSAPAPPAPPAPPAGAASYGPPVYGPPQPGAPQPAPPQYGAPQPAPSQYLAPAAAAFAPPPGYAPTGWTPPPKPGLIPLRPLTLGMILSASFQVLRRNPRPTFGLSLLITGSILLIGLGTVGLVTVIAASRAFTAVGADSSTVQAGAFAMTILAALVPSILSVIGMAILQGIIALEVARGTIGEKLRLRGLWRSARGRIGALIGWSLLVVLAVTIAVVVVIALIALVVAVGGVAGVIAGVVLGFAAFGAAAVLAAWFTTRLAFVPSALMLERLSLRGAIRRSWTLSTGYFWRTFGILLLVGFILYMVSNVISAPLGLVTGLGSTLINPNGTDASSIAILVVVTVLSFVIAIVFGAMSAVIQTATASLLYIDLRMRREGLDLELTRFVEARQAGDTTVENPYLVAQSPTAPGRVS